MTTIVYHHELGEIACDSRTTTDKIIVTDSAQKWFEKTGWRVFCSGDTCDIHAFQVAQDESDITEIRYLEFIKHHPKKGVWYGIIQNGVAKPAQPLTHSYAIGSGQQAAMAVLAGGASAVNAVQSAAKVDFRTGGDVHRFKALSSE